MPEQREASAAAVSPRRWTAKAAVERSRRNLNAAIASINLVAREWGDVDNTFVTRADELARELEEFRDTMGKEVRERLDAGEEIGI